MQILVVYTQLKDKTKLIGVHTGQFYLEARHDFFPRRRSITLADYQKYLNDSLYVDAKTFSTEVESNLDEESFVNMFYKKLQSSISSYGDEKTLAALNMQ